MTEQEYERLEGSTFEQRTQGSSFDEAAMVDELTEQAPKGVTLQDVELFNHFHYGECSVKIGPRGGQTEKVTRVRTTGRVKTWKRQPGRFSVPIMHGLYEHGYIDNDNAAQFHVAQHCAVSQW